MSDITKSLDEFLSRLASGREIGAIIAPDEATKSRFKHHLRAQHFSLVSKPNTLAAALNHHHKVMIDPTDMDERERKQLYDVVCQYPTGSIQITDQKTFKTYVVNRALQDHEVIIVLTAKELAELQRTFPLLDNLGMVWREEIARLREEAK